MLSDRTHLRTIVEHHPRAFSVYAIVSPLRNRCNDKAGTCFGAKPRAVKSENEPAEERPRTHRRAAIARPALRFVFDRFCSAIASRRASTPVGGRGGAGGGGGRLSHISRTCSATSSRPRIPMTDFNGTSRRQFYKTSRRSIADSPIRRLALNIQIIERSPDRRAGNK